VRSKRPIVGVIVTALVMGAATLGAAPVNAGTKTWHQLKAADVERTRITLDIAKSIDPAIDSILYGKGGEANFEHCTFNRTEQVSVARHTRWDAGARKGITLIMQFNNLADAQAIFQRAKNNYLPCTPATFGYKYPARVDVKGSYLKTKKVLRLQWAIYDDASKAVTLKANGLAIKRQGMALIITRSTTQNLATINQPVNTKLTLRQGLRYKAAAFF